MTVGELIEKLWEVHPDYPIHFCYSDDGRTTLEVDIIKGFEGYSSKNEQIVGVLLMSKEKHARAVTNLDYSNTPNN